MFKRLRTRWTLISDWMKKFPQKRKYTISTVIDEENQIDDIEIDDADRVIVNHQYLKHMAEWRKKARAEWHRMQGEKYGNIRPMPAIEVARSKRLA